MRSKVFLIQSKEWVANQEYPPKLPQIKPLTKFSFLPPPKKNRNRTFQTQKSPSIIPGTSNLEYPSWGSYMRSDVQTLKELVRRFINCY